MQANPSLHLNLNNHHSMSQSLEVLSKQVFFLSLIYYPILQLKFYTFLFRTKFYFFDIKVPQQENIWLVINFNVCTLQSPERSIFGSPSTSIHESSYYEGKTTFGGAASARRNRSRCSSPYQVRRVLFFVLCACVNIYQMKSTHFAFIVI